MNFNRKKIAIALAFSMVFQSSSIFASGYEDIGNHWAKDTITSFTEKGYVNGYSNNAFMPNEGITRAEFITLLNKSLNLKGKGNISFKDVNKKDWFYEQLAIAISNGYISGYGDNTFRPNEKVTRAEVCVMLAKLYGLSSSDKDDSSSVTKDEKQEIKELQEVPKWARASIKALIKADILGGYGSGSYGLTKPITRAESVVTVSKVMKSEDAKKIERISVKTDEGAKTAELPVPSVPEKPQLPLETPKPLQSEVKTTPAPSGGGGGGGGNSISSGEPSPSPLSPKETVPVQEGKNNVSPEGNRLSSSESGKSTPTEEKKPEEKKPTPKPEQNKKEGEQSEKQIGNCPDKETENKPEPSQEENITPSPEKQEPKEPKLPDKPEPSREEKVEPSPEKEDDANPPSSNQENNATNPPQSKEDETENNVTEENQSNGSDKEEGNKPSLPEKEEPKLPNKPEPSQEENGTPSPEKEDGANPPSSNQENNATNPPQSKEEAGNDAKDENKSDEPNKEENKPSLPEKEVPQEPKLPDKPGEKKPQPTPKDPENTVPPAIDPPVVNSPETQPLPNVPPEDKKTPEEKQAEELWNRLSTKKNNNLAQYTDEDGRIRTILWAKGITPPQMGEGKDFEKNTFSDFITYQAPYLPGNKWYDTNKTKDGGNTFADRNLCFAAVSSNALHWWLEQNESYVTKFIKEQEEKGVFLDSQKGTFKDLRLFIDSFQDQQQSKIFNMYKYYYYGKNSGFQSDILVDLFINGYKPKENAGVNDPDFNYDPQNLDPRGGFFHSVFGRYKLTDRTIAESYNHFNTFLKNAFSKGELAAVSHTTSGSYTHIITIWGIELDIKGNIVAIYISDSDDQNEGTNVGMKRYNVNNANGKTKLSNNVKNPSSGSTVVELQTFSLGEEKWQEYFKENNF